ncbi:hypothetical protein ACFVDQ_13715 [Streptomyces sp. NPDC057684]|uniref:hypothetical protein n=1 Tax=unclassified Streptomyces TaxID=2593676 RepID=UPI0036CADD1A
MAQPTPARARLCRDCDGFPLVAITTGLRNRDGSRQTLIATCHTCKGHGHTVPAALARAGR